MSEVRIELTTQGFSVLCSTTELLQHLEVFRVAGPAPQSGGFFQDLHIYNKLFILFLYIYSINVFNMYIINSLLGAEQIRVFPPQSGV